MEIMRLGGGFSGLDPHQAAAERLLQVGFEFNRNFGSMDFGSVYRVWLICCSNSTCSGVYWDDVQVFRCEKRDFENQENLSLSNSIK